MRTQRGFSLLETLLAGVVASLGLSGVAALLVASLSGTTDAEHRARALDLLVQLADTMRLSPGQDAVFLAPPPATTPPCLPDACEAADFAAANLHDWHLRVGLQLPRGAGWVCRDTTPDDGSADSPACDGVGQRVVKVFWREPDGEQRLVLETGP